MSTMLRNTVEIYRIVTCYIRVVFCSSLAHNSGRSDNTCDKDTKFLISEYRVITSSTEFNYT